MNFLSIFQHVCWIIIIISSMHNLSIGEDFWPHFAIIMLGLTCIVQCIRIDICEKS